MNSVTQVTGSQLRPSLRNLAPFLSVIAIVLAVAAAYWWYQRTGTPEYSLSQLGKAVKEKNYGKASYYVDEDRIASAVSQSLTDVLVTKYTKAIEDDPLPFTETRIEILHKIAPRFHDLALLGVQNGIRLLLSGNALLTGTSHISQLDVHNFSQLRPVRSKVDGDIADLVIGGLPQPNPFGLTELRIRMVRIPNTRRWRIEEVPDATAIFTKYFGVGTQ